MAKPDWGTKRTCPGCGAKFYDLRRNPVTCPKCESLYPPEPASPAKRSVAIKADVQPPVVAVEAKPVPPVAAVEAKPVPPDAAVEAKPVPPVAAVEAKPVPPDVAVDEDQVKAAVAAVEVADADQPGDDPGSPDGEKADKGAGIIEDASELGEDADDMAEVIDGMSKDDDR